MPRWILNDGGRAAAGYKGRTNDCVTRSIAIATGLPYQTVYDLIAKAATRERLSKHKRKAGKSHPRTGVWGPTVRRVMADLGWTWVPTMRIGQGCTVHLNAKELPPGRLVVSVSKHVTAVIDGVVHDTHDPTRGGTRCVYGYWQQSHKNGG